MANIIGWSAFYDDGKEYSSKITRWKELPLHGLLVVVEFYDDGTKEKHYAKDYYVFYDDKIFGTNDLHPYLSKVGVVKFGRWSANHLFNKILARANEAKWQ